mgnify:CR=1 FL=1
MPDRAITVQSQVDASDSTASTVSDKVKADGYYGNADGLHTVLLPHTRTLQETLFG